MDFSSCSFEVLISKQSDDMAETKRIDPTKIEKFLKNSPGRTQVLSFWTAAVVNGELVTVIDGELDFKCEDELLADSLFKRRFAIQKRESLLQAIKVSVKLKY